MRKYTLVIIFSAIFTLIYILSQPSLAIETEKCKDCHGAIVPIPKDSITKKCSRCHGMHATDEEPAIRTPEVVHTKHADAGRTVRQVSCLVCHQSPIECTKCHNSHDLYIKKTIPISKTDKNVTNLTENVNNITNISVKMSLCVDCHGNLPQPKGHEEFRFVLSKSKHKWMNCGTCHLNPYVIGENYKFELRFKNIFTVPINDSIKICKICHSPQYQKMTEETHGTVNKTCVNCHDPHTTTLTGPKFQIIPKETPTNINVKIETGISKSINWLTEKIPILNNPTLMMIILILIFVFASEYILSRHEEGQKVAYDMVKFKAKEETLKTLVVKLKSQDVNSVSQLLQEHGNILGMTMTKEEDKENPSSNIYKYVIFIDTKEPIDEISENELANRISSLRDVKSAEFTDKYEL